MLAWKLRAAGGSGVPYAAAIAAITNQTLYARADTATGADGATLTTTNWDNESVATPNINGTATYQTNILNGHRGILADAASELGSTQQQLTAHLAGSGLSYTMFAVEKRSGTQGSLTGNNRYQNSNVVGDVSGFFGMCFDTSSRRFLLYSFSGTAKYTDTTFDFTDNVPYVLAWRVAADGSVRTNFNGSISTAAASSQVNPSTLTGTVRVNKWTAGTNYGFEYLISSDAASDTDMDNLVSALRTKWGI